MAPLLAHVGAPQSLVRLATDFVVAFANTVDREIVWFHLLMLHPRFVASYHHKQWLRLPRDAGLLDPKQFVEEYFGDKAPCSDSHEHIQRVLDLIC